MGEKSALLLGASGLVGSELLHCLLNEKDYKSIVILIRKPLGIQHHKLIEILADFDQLELYRDHFKVNDVFCCLGTTIKKAKSREEMTKVDVGYPLTAAKLAHDEGAKQFLVISSMGADPQSSFSYSRMKGTLETELSNVGFQALHIFRPSLLLGKREESRLGESAAAAIFPPLSFLLVGPLKKYRAIQAKTVAQAMYRAAQNHNQGTTVYLSNEIEALGK
ncbi:NAD-dependent epimerase/dehydratase family protein [Bacillus sp. V59.32b]|uniref:NAD-dependent epimerase/dehydratase family protein n=1 Tax=Bacillus sp. V59.32b TaxID=1758642 RepID=UPI000E3EC74F|nr:NAD-dependent epimerase/dehydratase family protein [Bacillus sp. V59.32b]RFU64048.1 NAD-dependent epimerase/dehydratase family protein [Bacillus sp. V59.32b]